MGIQTPIQTTSNLLDSAHDQEMKKPPHPLAAAPDPDQAYPTEARGFMSIRILMRELIDKLTEMQVNIGELSWAPVQPWI
jgi:hypothetical protein